MSSKLDVIIFGASGFTGKYTVYEAVKVLSKNSWGIAGRNKAKLEDVLKEMGAKSGKDLSNIPIILADIGDENELKKMTEQCKVLVNCCGPYRFYGEPVVKACIETGTHHVDVSGEPQYMERMQLEYNAAAEKKGVYIISACGLDSIPCDLGVVFLENKFDGVVNSIETYLETKEKVAAGGASIHYGTWESAVYGLAHADELRGLRRQLYKERTPQMRPKLANRFLVHKSDFIESPWCLPFPGSDRSVVMRSQRFLYDTEKKRPIQMHAYVGFPNLFHVAAVAIVGLIFGILTRFGFGRKMLLNFPKLFSAGLVSHEGPSEEKAANTEFSITFYGEGWPKSEALAEPTDEYKAPPSKSIITRVKGMNPGYGATCVALLLSATTILNEKDKMPGSGGVLPPGAAYAKTSMITELCKNGFTFEVLKEQSLKK